MTITVSRVRRVLRAVPGLLLLAALPAAAAPNPPGGFRGVVVQSMTVVAHGDRSDLLTVERRTRCSRDCLTIQRSSDGGRTFARLPARGWTSGDLRAVAHPALGTVLLSSTSAGLAVSTDGGTTFRVVTPVTGLVDARRRDARSLDVVVAGDDGPPVLVTLPAGTSRTLPDTGLASPQLVLHPAYPRVPAGQPVAFAAGVDRATKQPVVLRCDAAFHCGRAVAAGPAGDFAHLYVSPGFAHDHTLLVTTIHTATVLRSTDGGATFTPVVLVPPRADATATTIQSVVFTPDFDRVAGTGAVYAAVLRTVSARDDLVTTDGGVYRSADAATWSRYGGAGATGTGVTALAVDPAHRVVAAGFFALPDGGGVVCSRAGTSWRASCAMGATAAGDAGPPAAAGTAPAKPGATRGARGGGAAATGAPVADTAAQRSTSALAARRSARHRSGGVLPVGAAVAALAAGAISVTVAVRRRTGRATA
jgi:hypothetical protein